MLQNADGKPWNENSELPEEHGGVVAKKGLENAYISLKLQNVCFPSLPLLSCLRDPFPLLCQSVLWDAIEINGNHPVIVHCIIQNEWVFEVSENDKGYSGSVNLESLLCSAWKIYIFFLPLEINLWSLPTFTKNPVSLLLLILIKKYQYCLHKYLCVFMPGAYDIPVPGENSGHLEEACFNSC